MKNYEEVRTLLGETPFDWEACWTRNVVHLTRPAPRQDLFQRLLALYVFCFDKDGNRQNVINPAILMTLQRHEHPVRYKQLAELLQRDPVTVLHALEANALIQRQYLTADEQKLTQGVERRGGYRGTPFGYVLTTRGRVYVRDLEEYIWMYQPPEKDGTLQEYPAENIHTTCREIEEPDTYLQVMALYGFLRDNPLTTQTTPVYPALMLCFHEHGSQLTFPQLQQITGSLHILDPLKAMVRKGLLERRDNIYTRTEAGRQYIRDLYTAMYG